MITKFNRRIFGFFILIFFIAQMTSVFGFRAYADSLSALDAQVAKLLPISAASFTQDLGSNDIKSVPVSRYFANLKPTDSYESSVLQQVYRTPVGNAVYDETFPNGPNDEEKVIMGWTSSGLDATDINGVNLVEKLSQQRMDQSGITNLGSVVFDLIALDTNTKPYSLPADAVISRQSLIQSILKAQQSGGGWGSFTLHDRNNSLEWEVPVYNSDWTQVIDSRPAQDSDANVDMTGMVLTALAPYYQDANYPDVKAAVDRAIQYFNNQVSSVTNCGSLAQMIIGLTAVNVDPTSFNQVNLVQQLMTYASPNGLFKWDYSSKPDDFTTKDAITAMASYLKYKNHSGYGSVYYEMTGPGTLTDPPIPQVPTGTGGTQSGKVTLAITGYNGASLMPPTAYDLQSNDTPYTVLVRAIGANNVKSKKDPTTYVQSIDGLSEFDKGPLSGWMCTINGQFIKVGVDSSLLNSGDVVQWIYTANGGQDVGASSGSSISSVSAPAAAVVNAIQALPISYDNTKPISQVVQTITVQNQDHTMTQDQSAAIKQALQSNAVNVSQTIVPSQDQSISDQNQNVQLYIPENALTSSKAISVQEVQATPDHKELLTPIYNFGPNGTHFEKPVVISLKVPLYGTDLSQVALVWLDEISNQWVPIPAVVDAQTGLVTGEVNHFTKFAVIDRSQLSGDNPQLDQAIQSTSQKLLTGDVSDWGAFALSRAGQTVPANYLNNLKAQLDQNQGSFRNVTDYERMVLGVLGAGGDPLNVDGYNLLEKIYNNSRMTSQGTNGVIFALIALDSKNYQTPDNALWNRNKLTDWLLKNQNQDGGWALVAGDPSDLDLTSMALAALAPYQNQDNVKKAVDSAVQWIQASSQQSIDNSESIAQEIEGLAALGKNPTDASFNRSGKDLISCLLQYQQTDGGFIHQSGQADDEMATEQALAALNAYQFYLKGQGSLYQFISASQPTEPQTSSQSSYADYNQISSWAINSVAKARTYGLMKGVSSTTFGPKQPVTRAQFASIMLRLLGKSSDQVIDEKNSIFDDVKPGDWYYNDVRAAKEAGLVHGVSSTSFEPNAPITREQMAVMIANAYHLQSTAQTTFGDQDEIDGYALSALEALHEKGLLVGYNGGIQPLGEATREMVAALAVRLYEENQTR